MSDLNSRFRTASVNGPGEEDSIDQVPEIQVEMAERRDRYSKVERHSNVRRDGMFAS